MTLLDLVKAAKQQDITKDAAIAYSVGRVDDAVRLVEQQRNRRIRWELFSRVGRWAAGEADANLDRWLEREIDANGGTLPGVVARISNTGGKIAAPSGEHAERPGALGGKTKTHSGTA